MKKPCILQINSSGAWRNIVRFDAAEQVAVDAAMEHGSLLVRLTEPQSKLRVVMDDGFQTPLMLWKLDTGWKEWRTA